MPDRDTARRLFGLDESEAAALTNHRLYLDATSLNIH
jgi:hypothetical protein